MKNVKRLLLLLGLILAAPAYAGRGWINGTGGSPGISAAGSYSRTIPETDAGLAGDSVELDGLRLEYNMTLTGDDTLGSGLRVELNCDMSSPANPGTDTRHCGAGFFETNFATNQQYFGFGIESSIKNRVGASAHANGAAIVDINHGKIFNDLNITQNYPLIGTNIRLDFFATGSESVSFSTHAFGYMIRPEAYASGDTGRIFGWYSPTDRDIQNVNAGNVFKVATSSAVSGGGTFNFSQSCGGAHIITSTGIITMNATTFANTPNSTIASSSITGGSYNADCDVLLINGNLTPGRTITLVDTADFLPIGATLTLGALGGATRLLSYPTAGVWIQTQAPTK